MLLDLVYLVATFELNRVGYSARSSTTSQVVYNCSGKGYEGLSIMFPINYNETQSNNQSFGWFAEYMYNVK